MCDAKVSLIGAISSSRRMGELVAERVVPLRQKAPGSVLMESRVGDLGYRPVGGVEEEELASLLLEGEVGVNVQANVVQVVDHDHEVRVRGESRSSGECLSRVSPEKIMEKRKDIEPNSEE